MGHWFHKHEYVAVCKKEEIKIRNVQQEKNVCNEKKKQVSNLKNLERGFVVLALLERLAYHKLNTTVLYDNVTVHNGSNKLAILKN